MNKVLSSIKGALSKDDTIVLTANQRQQRFLLNVLFGENQICYRCPNIFSLDQWASECWLSIQDLGLESGQKNILSENLELEAWRSLCHKTETKYPLLNSRSLPEKLQQARIIMETWDISSTDIVFYTSEENQFLLDQLEEFHSLILHRGFITKESAFAKIAEAFSSQKLNRYSKLIAYGFNEFSPLLKRLITEAADSLEEVVTSSIDKVDICKCEFQDIDEELNSIAGWCQDVLTKKPNAKIGIIAPNLSKDKPRIINIFTKQFNHKFLSQPTEKSPPPIDVSMGQTLGSLPIVFDALKLLELIKKDIDYEALRSLNISSYWGDAFDSLHGELDHWISSLDSFDVSTSAYFAQRKSLLKQRRQEELDEMTQRCENHEQGINAFIELSRDNKRKQTKYSYQDAIALIKRLLKALNWPGVKTLNSEEYQTVQRFFQLLEELGTYDNIADQGVTLERAIHTLQLAADSVVFQPQRKEQPIQIMGLMEGAGLLFDYCWVMGLNSDQLPAAAKPNPFIPYAIQVEKNTPRSTPERELAYGKQLISTYSSCAENVVFSYHEKAGDDSFDFSPLVNDVRSIHKNDILVQKNPAEIYVNKGISFDHFLQIDSSFAPKIPIQYKLTGGAAHLELYSANPLYAFLVFRLGTQDDNSPSLGLTLSQKGSIIHEVLAYFWKKFPDSTQVNTRFLQHEDQLTPPLDDELHTIIDKVFTQQGIANLRGKHAVHINLEKERMKRLLTSWLEEEFERGPFKVLETETKYTIELEKRFIDIRVDRIDQLETGEKLVIDYKTGEMTLSGLQKTSIPSPQLALYTLIDPDNIGAVAYAEINRKSRQFKGIGQLPNPVSGILLPEKLKHYELPNNWEDVKAWWHTELSMQMQHLCDGYCPNISAPSLILNHYKYLAPIARESIVE